jgi:hypothetical protein
MSVFVVGGIVHLLDTYKNARNAINKKTSSFHSTQLPAALLIHSCFYLACFLLLAASSACFFISVVGLQPHL